LVKIKYKQLPAVFTIEDALEKESFFSVERKIETGEFKSKEQVTVPLSEATQFVEGVARISAQEHFYLETQASLVVPSKEHDEMEIYASTQNPKETQDFVAHVLGIDFNRVVCRVKRLGGGFGGKESRSVFLSCALAVAAKKLLRPVRCMLTREEDMVMSGTRHPFMGQYKVGFTKQGKLISLDLKVF
jgi:xanthine dehydrogenase/oxidase